MDDERPAMRVRRVTEADIEQWLGLEPGHRLEVAGGDLDPEVTPQAARPMTWLGSGLLLSAIGLFGLLDALSRGDDRTVLLACVLCLGPAVAMIGAAVNAAVAQRRRRRVVAVSAGGDGLELRRREEVVTLPWSRVASLQCLEGPFSKPGRPARRGSVWLLSFRDRAGSAPLPQMLIGVRDDAAVRLVGMLNRMLQDRAEGVLVPGDPDPSDLTLPRGALSPASLSIERSERGLSRAEEGDGSAPGAPS